MMSSAMGNNEKFAEFCKKRLIYFYPVNMPDLSERPISDQINFYMITLELLFKHDYMARLNDACEDFKKEFTFLE